MMTVGPDLDPLEVQRQILQHLLPVARAQRQLMHTLHQLRGAGMISDRTALQLLTYADQLDAAIHGAAAIETELARHTR